MRVSGRHMVSTMEGMGKTRERGVGLRFQIAFEFGGRVDGSSCHAGQAGDSARGRRARAGWDEEEERCSRSVAVGRLAVVVI